MPQSSLWCLSSHQCWYSKGFRYSVVGLFVLLSLRLGSSRSLCPLVEIMYLSFADDLLIFIEGNIESVQCVLQVLKQFEERSGLAFRYLGVPMNSRKLSLASCEPLLHQIKTRFSSTFWCSSFVLPKGCVAKINSMCSAFLWKGNLEGHHSARIAWETVVKTKEQGGLGVKDLQTWNKACCLRLIWLLFFRPDSVWVSLWFIFGFKMERKPDSGLIIGALMGDCRTTWKDEEVD